MPGEQQTQAPQLSEHDAQMVALVDANAAAAQAAANGGAPQGAPAGEQQPVVTARPEHVPEKFWDAAKGQLNTEALLKAHAELESKVGKPAETPPEGQTPEQKAAEDAVKSAKLDMATLQTEFDSSGALSDGSYAALEAAGIPKEVVNAYIAGQQALVDQHAAQGFALVGGQDSYSKMVQWAATNMSPAEQDAFNTSVVGTPEQMSQAIMGLKARYEGSMGRDPVLLAGQQGGTPASEAGFASRAQVTEAMSDPRYRKDPAYRAMVERRIGLMDNF
ncbi:hypothetical protein ASC87_13380 [Rhizobacter sp. Root1221]|nr:hypothetical protein ASC87_13380 [Rhizobacter sp. Root1221]